MKKWILWSILMVSILTASGCASNSTPTATFTLEQLAAYDGLDGAKAYIAVDGMVYDVTNEDNWINGSHQGMHLAGTDATSIFASSPHSATFLAGLKVVGILVVDNNSTTAEIQLPVFTLTELAAYTGANGSTAYIAVSGVVYDVTNVFTNGIHQGIQLGGKDVTSIFTSSPHTMSQLNGIPIVGSLEGSPVITVPNTNTPNETTTYYPVVTTAELALNTGANGSTAYIAVSGVVYDVTNVFTNGIHQGIQLGGKDVTSIFTSSPHTMSQLNGIPIVGSLEGSPMIPKTTTTTNPGGGYDDDDDDDDVNLNSLPQTIIDYIEANYPNLTIDEIEFEHGNYEIEFTNDLELLFDQNGQFIKAEYED
jgi:predicted heme/steroid binding protein